jgi:hypothetical protein
MNRQFYGYISGHGRELAAFLSTQRLTSGIPVSEKPGEGKVWSNGAGCLAAQLVAHFKTEPGGIYIVEPGTLGGYNYTVEVGKYTNAIRVKVHHGESEIPIFDGTLEEFTAYVANHDEDD